MPRLLAGIFAWDRGRRSRTAALALAACLTAGLLAGCGGSEGVAAGAAVGVYLAAPLHGREAAAGRRACAGARAGLASRHGRAGDVRVRLICLDDSGAGEERTGGTDAAATSDTASEPAEQPAAAGAASGARLAAIGAAARRASQDSATVAFVTVADPLAARFSDTIVEAAGIAPVTASSGAKAIHRVLAAIAAANSSSLRTAIREALG